MVWKSFVCIHLNMKFWNSTEMEKALNFLKCIFAALFFFWQQMFCLRDGWPKRIVSVFCSFFLHYRETFLSTKCSKKIIQSKKWFLKSKNFRDVGGLGKELQIYCNHKSNTTTVLRQKTHYCKNKTW